LASAGTQNITNHALENADLWWLWFVFTVPGNAVKSRPRGTLGAARRLVAPALRCLPGCDRGNFFLCVNSGALYSKKLPQSFSGQP
jgi:hypothetical protein